MQRTLENLNKNDFCTIEHDGKLINVIIVNKDCTRGMFSAKHQVKVKPVGTTQYLWLKPSTKVIKES